MSTQIESVGGELFINGKNFTPLGVNQTWQDLNRSLNTVYTNNTGRPIQVVISRFGSATTTKLIFTMNGTVEIYGGHSAGEDRSCISVVIPNGDTYEMSVSGGADSGMSWLELRGV